MHNFHLHIPTRLVFGKKTVPRIGREVLHEGCSKALVVAGCGSAEASGILGKVLESLDKNGIAAVMYSGVRPNPEVGQIEAAVEVARSEDVDCVLGVGGGSALDAAKAVAAGVFLERIPDMIEEKRDILRALPLFAVPTTAGPGSEMNDTAVLSSVSADAQRKKRSIRGPALFPRAAVVDPRNQYTVPLQVRLFGAVDILSHLLEHFVCMQAGGVGAGMSAGVFGGVLRAVERMLGDAEDYSAAADLAWAAMTALNGTAGAGSGGGDWTCHLLAHAISAYYPKAAHGACMAVLLPLWLEQAVAAEPVLFDFWSTQVFGVKVGIAGVDRLRELFAEWSLPQRLAELGVQEKDLEAIRSEAFAYGRVGRTLPFSAEEVTKLLRRALHGS